MTANGFQILGLIDGGSANKGQDVHLKIRVSDGQAEHELGLFIAHDLLGQLIAGLATFGGMARNTRMSRNPNEEADASFTGAHAMPLSNIYGGQSLSEKNTAILTLQFDAGQGRVLNQYASADASALEKFANTLLETAARLTADGPKLSKH